ncbi:reverse transcriptase domain-containing protein [Sphingomonas sp.]|uniref:reverse transcriptase domain-containing protein n=1 Tax=Sphingomonas sp. TaxID=28214 RepID=UPI0035BC4066
MAVQFENFAYSYENGGKPYFAPSDLGRKIGEDIKAQVEDAHKFDPFVYHLKNGGHVAALHSHRHHQLFARVDIRRFFYGIARSRVQRAISEIGILRSRHYAKWSCVKNRYGEPSYALPYGFVQSPILATLVLMQSAVGAFLRKISADPAMQVSVYMDDIAISSDDADKLRAAFDGLLASLAEAHFEISEDKVREPGPAMDLFNCNLSFGHTEVRQERVDKFLSEQRSQESLDGFARYQVSVEDGNI